MAWNGTAILGIQLQESKIEITVGCQWASLRSAFSSISSKLLLYTKMASGDDSALLICYRTEKKQHLGSHECVKTSYIQDAGTTELMKEQD